MTTNTQDVFVKTAEEKFSFLLDKGFKGPFLRYAWPISKIYYIGRNVALECVLDEKDYYVGCYISKAINGQPVQTHALNDQGVPVRYLLHAWVSTHVSIPASFYTRVSRKMSRDEQIPIFLDTNLRLLKEYGQKIIDDSPDIFPAG